MTSMLHEDLSFLHIKRITCPGILSESKWMTLNSEIRYRDHDILIVSYPKSGTTLLEQCVLLLPNGGDKARLNPAKKNVYSPSAPEAGGKIWQEACLEQDPEVNFEASIDPMFLFSSLRN